MILMVNMYGQKILKHKIKIIKDLTAIFGFYFDFTTDTLLKYQAGARISAYL